MKIFMISAGLKPVRTGGLPAYVEDLIGSLKEKGHEIVYLNPAGIDSSLGPRAEKKTDEIVAYTFFNASYFNPLLRGVHFPEREVVSSAWFKKNLLEIITRENPDLIHIHELAGFPVDIIPELKSLGKKIVFTAQDYFALCPTFFLFKHDKVPCSLKTSELECNRCCRQAGFVSIWRMRRSIGVRIYSRNLFARIARKSMHTILSLTEATGERLLGIFSSATSYIHRREEFIRCLKAADAILCMSKTQFEIFRRETGLSNLKHMYLSRKTFSRSPVKCPGDFKRSGEKVVFSALNISASHKGNIFLLETFRKFAEKFIHVELRVYGCRETLNEKQIKFIPSYTEKDLDRIAGESDFLIIPSLWEEAYGYVGPEMLSRGLPVLASHLGGMKEYIRDGENGILFDPSSPGDLSRVLSRVATDENLRKNLLSGAIASSGTFVSMEEHTDQLESFYHELLEVCK